tara:strand:+ start:380 stop:580 length:201 start_codon:yes stop_codon:yes gene_type:complete
MNISNAQVILQILLSPDLDAHIQFSAASFPNLKPAWDAPLLAKSDTRYLYASNAYKPSIPKENICG